MKIVNRKTRKAIRKTVKKAIKKHGPQVAAGLAGSLASTLATLASTDAPGTHGKQSNLAKMSRKVKATMSDMMSGDTTKKSRSRAGSRSRKAGKKSAQVEPVERDL